MSRDNDLPFERGTTFCEGDATLIADLGTEFIGRRYRDVDPTTLKEVELIVLKASSALTAPGGIGQKFTAAYLDRVSGPIDAAGLVGIIADPVYTGDVASGDLFYGIYSGSVSGVKVDTTNLVTNGPVIFHSNGMITPLTTGNVAQIGISVAAVTAAAAGATTCELIVARPGAGSQKTS